MHRRERDVSCLLEILLFLVLAFSVVGAQTSGGSGNEEVVKTVFVIDEAIELVCRGEGAFSDFGSRTKGHEVMKENPGTDLKFSRSPVAMEVA